MKMLRLIVFTSWLFTSSAFAGAGLNPISAFKNILVQTATWWKGSVDPVAFYYPTFGTKGVAAAANIPGGRFGHAQWIDSSGNIWVFGGSAVDNTRRYVGLLNDLWKYDVSTGHWTWVKGNNTDLAVGVYGTKGVAAAANTPGGRYQFAFWQDSAGNFWLFGGTGYGTTTTEGSLNDLWKFDPATENWTWVKGSNTTGAGGTYGTKGTAASTNTPGSRFAAVAVVDSNGIPWLIGGYATIKTAPINIGYANDVWKFNGTDWVWMAGSGASSNIAGTFGTKGTEASGNVMGSKANQAMWADNSGNIYIMGGWGTDSAGTEGHLNDLWKFNTSNNYFTWLAGSNTVAGAVTPNYGTQGVEAASNSPSWREIPTGWFYNGKLYMFAGNGNTSTETTIPLSEYWSFNLSNNQWTWLGGSNTGIGLGNYGTKGVGSTSNLPSGRDYLTSLKDTSGNIWIYGGERYSTGLNDMWKHNPSTGEWTWITGYEYPATPSVYGTTGVASSTNTPSGRDSGYGTIDVNGKFWMFGGWGPEETGAGQPTGDLWSFDPTTKNWTFHKGTKRLYVGGVYGTKGTPNSANFPGCRKNHVMWYDSSGNIYLFGGFGWDSAGTMGYLNDFWRYNPSTDQWTWLGGSNLVSSTGTAGTKGTGSTTNIPSARQGHKAAYDPINGNVYIHGGVGYSTGAAAYENNLWRYNNADGKWTWLTGVTSANPNPTYGTKGTPSATTTPGGRFQHAMLYDNNGKIWLLGGRGLDSVGALNVLNDLWSYNISTNQWTWVSGANTVNQASTTGTQGIAAASNVMGARFGPAFWMDATGGFWVFGGCTTTGCSGLSAGNFSNDLWHFNPKTLMWTFVNGKTPVMQQAVTGTKGTGSAYNYPGARTLPVYWRDNEGRGWVFSGVTVNPLGDTDNTNDLWSFP